MINDQFSPEEHAIIQQIQAVPRLELGSVAREAIRGRMLDEFRAVSQQAAAKAAAQTRLVFLTVTGVIVITVIVVIILAIISNQNTPQTVPSTAPSATSQATVALTETSSVMIAPTVATQDAVDVSETDTPELIPLPTEIISPTGALASQPPVSASSTESAEAALPTSTLETVLMITPSVTAISDQQLSIPAGTATLDAIIVIQGPVINIVNNVITIYDFDIEVEANHPILYLIEIGDLVRIEGEYGSGGMIVASVVSNLSDTPLVSGATVSLDGPVESINGNVIVVNGISVQLDANDPLLQTVQVGQFVSLQGNFQGSGTSIVLVVVTIVINTNTNTGGGSGGDNCVWQESGMSGMGKWKCKGSNKGSKKGS